MDKLANASSTVDQIYNHKKHEIRVPSPRRYDATSHIESKHVQKVTRVDPTA